MITPQTPPSQLLLFYNTACSIHYSSPLVKRSLAGPGSRRRILLALHTWSPYQHSTGGVEGRRRDREPLTPVTGHECSVLSPQCDRNTHTCIMEGAKHKRLDLLLLCATGIPLFYVIYLTSIINSHACVVTFAEGDGGRQ